MTTVLDSYALVALVLQETSANRVADIVRGDPAAMSALNYAEAADRLIRRRGYPEHTVRIGLKTFVDAGVELRPVDEAIGWRAGELRSRHYHRTRSPLSLADCVALASCRPGETLATGDDALLRAATAEGIETAPL